MLAASLIAIKWLDSKNFEAKELDVSKNEIGIVGAKAIAYMKTLQKLDISYNKIGDNGAKAISENSSITKLVLSVNYITDTGANFIANMKGQLEELDISKNQIGDSGIQALKGMPNGKKFNLEENKKHEDSAIDTAGSKIRELETKYKIKVDDEKWDLSEFEIKDADIKSLSQLFSCTKNLIILKIEHGDITHASIKYIAMLSTLKELYLKNNKVGNNGAKLIAEHLEKLEKLDLAQNNIGNEGIKEIVKLKYLKYLHLRNNNKLETAQKTALQRLQSKGCEVIY